MPIRILDIQEMVALLAQTMPDEYPMGFAYYVAITELQGEAGEPHAH